MYATGMPRRIFRFENECASLKLRMFRGTHNNNNTNKVNKENFKNQFDIV